MQNENRKASSVCCVILLQRSFCGNIYRRHIRLPFVNNFKATDNRETESVSSNNSSASFCMDVYLLFLRFEG